MGYSIVQLGLTGILRGEMSKANPTIHTNGIAVLEFLDAGEYKVGQSLLESFIEPSWKSCPNKYYYSAHNKIEFVNNLTLIANAALNQGFKPIIHIDAHGGRTGISNKQTGGEQITWEELKPHFQRINQYSEFNLLILLSTCSGSYLASTLVPMDSAPCWGLAGPIGIASPYDLVEDYGNFYKIFFEKMELGEALRSLNRFSNRDERHYVFTAADIFFNQLWKEYLRTAGSRTEVEKRAEKLINRHIRVSGGGKKTVGNWRKRVIRDLSNHRSFFEKFSRIFFMEDQLPGNLARFGISYDNVDRHFDLKYH